ncbi:fungal-specific transcription factor domain-containing protein [Xylariaceae sp. FL0804]|nr:fungal-specific transcription factor domain-containing protein [Xylariaceae sp. FL0804]
MKVRKGCWTCSARKIQCDGGRPTCQKCARSQRVCQGYGMRLSWPRDGDRRRSIKGLDAPPVIADQSRVSGPVYFINTTWRDLESYNDLFPQTQLSDPTASGLSVWAQPRSPADHKILLHYFCHVGYRSLFTFGEDPSQIRDMLMRMALVQEEASGVALFCAILAFSSLHRHGINQQALQLKISALHYLSQCASDVPLTPPRAAQHIAASMLLAAFEIMLPLESSDGWLCHIRGAIEMAQATRIEHQSYENHRHLLDWVYYHEVVSRFAIHHWHQTPSTHIDVNRIATISGPQNSSLMRYRPAPPSINPSHGILNLLSEVCDTVLDPADPRTRTPEYQMRLQVLEEAMENVPAMPVTDAAELYRMATRVYLARTSQNTWQRSASLDSIMESTYAVAKTCNSCCHWFPLFILACEAREDEHRSAVLSLIERTGESIRKRSIGWVRNAVQSVWVQRDLHEDSDLLMDYVAIMNAVVSSSSTVPSFA